MMPPGPESRLERLLRGGTFCVTGEVVPPRSSDPEAVRAQARELIGCADAVNVTDNPTASAHMSPLAGVALVARTGLEPVLQLTCRDRNRLALTGDLLGAWALGARNVLCLTGDPPSVGDHPGATAVFDLSVAGLVRLAAGLRNDARLPNGVSVQPAPRYFIGVADSPLVAGYDFGRLEEKIDAGAAFMQTQIVFDLEALGEWADRARDRGIFERIFVLAGMAVPASARSARYMRDHLDGVRLPDRLIEALDEAGQDAPTVAVNLLAEMVGSLRSIPGIAGVHLMGLGRLEPVRRVVTAAGLFPRPTLA